MQKEPRLINRHFNPVTIDLDDFYELLRVIRQYCSDASIRANGFRLDAPEEIKDVRTLRVRDLDISGYRPYFRLWFAKHGAHLMMASDDELVSAGVAATIASILHTPTRRVIHRSMEWIAPLLLGAVVGAIPLVDRFPKNMQRGVAVVLLIGFAVACLLGVAAFVLSGAVLLVRPKNAHGKFWERNKERIEKLVFLVAGALLTILGQLVVKKLTTP